MLRGVCKVFLVGKAGSDGVLLYTPSGTPVLRFNLATETGPTAGKELKPSLNWIKLVVVGSQAEDRDNAVTKGCTCYVEATLRTRDFQDKITGSKHSVTEVFVNSDGIFRVYQTPASTRQARPEQETKNSCVPISSSKRSIRTNDPDSTLNSRGSPHILPPNDDVWPSFEGLQIHEPNDSFD